jgi:hypothetical protein
MVAVQCSQQRRFATAVRAMDDPAVAAVDPKRDATQHRDSFAPDGRVPQREQQLAPAVTSLDCRSRQWATARWRFPASRRGRGAPAAGRQTAAQQSGTMRHARRRFLDAMRRVDPWKRGAAQRGQRRQHAIAIGRIEAIERLIEQ